MKEDDNVIDFLMGQPNVMPRLNDRVLSTSAKYLDLTGVVASGIKDLTTLSSHQLTAAFADSISYLSSTTKATLSPLTVWMVTDVTSEAGRELVKNALEYLQNSRLVRFAVLHNPSHSLTNSECRTGVQRHETAGQTAQEGKRRCSHRWNQNRFRFRCPANSKELIWYQTSPVISRTSPRVPTWTERIDCKRTHYWYK